MHIRFWSDSRLQVCKTALKAFKTYESPEDTSGHKGGGPEAASGGGDHVTPIGHPMGLSDSPLGREISPPATLWPQTQRPRKDNVFQLYVHQIKTMFLFTGGCDLFLFQQQVDQVQRTQSLRESYRLKAHSHYAPNCASGVSAYRNNSFSPKRFRFPQPGG